MFGFLSFIPIIGKLFDTVGSITNRLTDARIASRNADTEDKRIAAQGQVKELEYRLAAIQAQTAGPLGFLFIVTQTLLAIPVIMVMWKIVIYDQVFGWGFTNPLGDDVWSFIKLVATYYFVSSVASMLKH